MSIICPAILASNPDDYRQQIERVASFASRLQIDIMDGSLTDNCSINLVQAWWPEGIRADLHLMMARPDQHLETIVSLKPDLVIVHAEAESNLKQLLSQLRNHQLKVGLAVLPTTNLNQLEEFLPVVDHLLVFASKLGHQGTSADLGQLAKVIEAKVNHLLVFASKLGHQAASADLERLAKVIEAKKQGRPNLEIGWDGGINADNIKQLAEAGVDVFNVGSYLQTAPDPQKAYDLLTCLL